MKVEVEKDKYKLGKKAGRFAAEKIRNAIADNRQANIILATGKSQFETLEQLVREPGIDWGKVRMFHLDEYIGLPATANASFRRYLKERFIEKIDPLLESHLIRGEAINPEDECHRLGAIIQKSPIDVALVGIGENGHLAFNDPPANFEVEDPYLVVDLDSACRKQQLGEGWFNHLEEVPRRAISMSIRQILKSKSIVCSVPDRRKAQAVKDCLTLPVSTLHPASILQQHADCTFFLDEGSALLVSELGL